MKDDRVYKQKDMESQKRKRIAGGEKKNMETKKIVRIIQPSTVACVGFLMNETFSEMIEFLNFYSLIAFRNSKVGLYAHTGIEPETQEASRERTLRGHVPLNNFVISEDIQESYAMNRVGRTFVISHLKY